MKISVVGAAGNVGSCAAFAIGLKGTADELVLIDTFKQDFADQHAFDIGTALTGMDTAVVTGDYETMAGSDIVVIAAGSAQVVASRSEVLPQNLPIIRSVVEQIMTQAPEAVIVTATNPVCPLNYAVYRFSGKDRRQCIGYSMNDSLRFRMYLSQATRVASSRIDALVIGEHGNSQVPLYSSVKIDGVPYIATEDIRRQVSGDIANLPNILEPQREKTGRTAAWTTAVGLAAVCDAIGRDTGETMPCSVTLDGEYGYSGISMGVPAVLGRNGVEEIIELELEPGEREGLDRSVTTLKGLASIVDDYLQPA